MKNKPAFFNKKRVESIPDLDKTHREEIKNLIKFCDEIEERSDNSQYSKNYAIIRLVSVIEGELKAIVTTLVDDFRIKPSRVVGHQKMEIELDKLEEYGSTDVTKGKIVTVSMTATNIHNVNDYLSGINKLSFFYWFEELANEVIEDFRGWWDLFEQTVHARNDATHNLIDIELSKNGIIEIIKNMQKFAVLTFYFSKVNLYLDKKDLESAEKICKEELGDLKIDKFKEITESHRRKYKLRPKTNF